MAVIWVLIEQSLVREQNIEKYKVKMSERPYFPRYKAVEYNSERY